MSCPPLKELLARLATETTTSEEVEEILQAYMENLPSHMLKQETLQKAFGFSDQDLEDLYTQAYQNYLEGHLKEAHDLFRWLVLLNPFHFISWMGFAAALQQLSSFEEALQAYAMATLLEADNPLPHFYAYGCYKSLGEKEEANKALCLCREYALLNPSLYTMLLHEVETLGAA